MTVTNFAIVGQNRIMTYRTCKCALILLVAGMCPLGPGFAYAALGADYPSVLADGADLHGTANSETGSHYTVWEISAETGIRVREFLNEGGVVFAVTWKGPVSPDL